MSSVSVPAPLLKWAGGKRQLLESILARLPESIGTYYEPFIGGGAVFFALSRIGRFRRAVISDMNVELVEMYRAVQSNVDGVIEALESLTYSEEAYYRIRAQKPRTEVRRAARMIYLNRTGYNGLYRVNRAGEFNVPFGRYVKPKICDEGRLRAVSLALRNVEIRHGDFADAVKEARAGDAVYFDPPYVPLTSTARFAEYCKDAFSLDHQTRLRDLYRELLMRGISAVLSNSDTGVTRRLYEDFVFDRVSARRSINSNSDRRGSVYEILVHGVATETAVQPRDGARARSMKVGSSRARALGALP